MISTLVDKHSSAFLRRALRRYFGLRSDLCEFPGYEDEPVLLAGHARQQHFDMRKM